MEGRIRTVIAKTIKVPEEQITAEVSADRVQDWDSARHLDLVLALEDEFAIQFTDEEMVQLVSFEAISEIVRRALDR